MRRFFLLVCFLIALSFLTPRPALLAQAVDTGTPTDTPPASSTPTFIFIPVTDIPTPTATATIRSLTATAAKPGPTSSTVEVKKAKIEEDGSIIHVVEKGQAVWTIGMAYGVSADDILRFNNLPADPVLQIGQKLIVRPPYTPTPTPTASNTPFPPTPTATRTLQPITPGPTLSPTPSITPTSPPLFVGVDALKGINRRSMGIGLIIFCALGLGGILYYTMKRRKEEKTVVDPVEELLSSKQDREH